MTSKFKLTLILRVLSSVFIIGFGLPLGSVGSNPLKYTTGVTYRYMYETRTSLNDEKAQSKRNVGFSLSAAVHLTPVWANDGVLVVELQVLEPRLTSVSRELLSHELKNFSRSPVYFEWHQGEVIQVLASEDQSTLSLNLKRGIISLFQVSLQDGTQSQMDVSGNCRVVYHWLSDTNLKKSKISCSSLDSKEQLKQTNEIFGINMTFSSETEYNIANSVIASASAQESNIGAWNLERNVSPVVYSKQSLKLIDTVQSKFVVQAATLESVLKELRKDKGRRLYAAVLLATHERYNCSSSDCPRSANELLSNYRKHLNGKSAGNLDTVDSFVSLVNAFRVATKDTILSLLNDNQNTDIVLPLIDVVTAAQTTASQAALMEFIKFDNDDVNLLRAERYLLAVAMSTDPATNTVTDLLKLFNQNVSNEPLRESIGDALGAVTNTYRRLNSNQTVVFEVEKALLDKLATCQSNLQCQLALVRSIGNAQLPGTLPTLCELALTSPYAVVSETALNGLFKLDTTFLSSSVLVNDIVRKIFYERSERGYDTAVRSQALRILLSLSTLSKRDIQDIMMSSLDPWNTDYNMFIQASVFDTAKRNESFKVTLREVLAMSNFSNYHVLAPKGKSLSFTADLAETADFVSTYRMFVENGRSGIMKRSGMDVDISSSSFKMPVYNFKLYAAGLEGLLGEQVDDAEKDMEVTAGLGLELLGVSLRPVTFFTGQGGLMSALWNAPSELTPALQTMFLVQDRCHHVSLQNGLVVELNVTAAVSMSLEGSLSVSLWNKNAESLIKNRGALKLFSRLSIMSSSFRATVEWDSHTESFIDFRTDVNFYDGVVMCLQMSRPHSQYRVIVTKRENSRGFKTSYRSRKVRSTNIYALSYPLPRRNSENCRKLLTSS